MSSKLWKSYLLTDTTKHFPNFTLAHKPFLIRNCSGEISTPINKSTRSHKSFGTITCRFTSFPPRLANCYTCGHYFIDACMPEYARVPKCSFEGSEGKGHRERALWILSIPMNDFSRTSRMWWNQIFWGRWEWMYLADFSL